MRAGKPVMVAHQCHVTVTPIWVAAAKMLRMETDQKPALQPTLAPEKKAQTSRTAAQTLQAQAPETPFVSKGQKIHKWATYLSVDWVFNAAVGVSFAYWGKFTKSGQKFWSGPIQKGFKKVLSPLIKNEEKLNTSIGRGSMFMSIIAGGMFTIPPLMVLENQKNRIGISKKLDQWIYGKDAVENDPKFEASYQAIKDEPKKEFGPGMTSRFAALSPLLAIVLIPQTNKLSTDHFFSHVSNGSKWVARKLGFSAKNLKDGEAIVGAKKVPVTANDKWEFIHEGVGMDFGLGLPYAGLHAMFYNMFAKGSDKENTAKEQTAPKTAPFAGAVRAKESAMPSKDTTPPKAEMPDTDHARATNDLQEGEALPSAHHTDATTTHAERHARAVRPTTKVIPAETTERVAATEIVARAT
jgi:hypothetical protein